jgi:AcrR family transcriptional regulator
MSDFSTQHGVTEEAICARLYERHMAFIRVKKSHVAIPNLTRVLTVALDLANGKGFHSMTMRDLSEASGLSMGALYNYIADKEMLLRLILDGVADAVERVLAPIGEGGGDPRVQLHALIRNHVLLSEAMLPWFFFSFMEAKSFNRTARDHALGEELRTEAMLAAPIAAGMEHGLFRPGDATMTAALIKPLLQDWYVKRWKHRGRGVTPEAYADTVIGFVDRAISVKHHP